MNLDLSGQLVDHRYRLLRPIGAGGTATIYEATDTNLDKRVAVKVLSPLHWEDPVQVGRFQREARSIARIRHEHLVDVTHHGMTDDGMPFLVMELLAGWDLQSELRRLGGAIPWPRAITITVQVLAALGAAHEAGVVHRDVKPSNCFLVQRRGGGDFVKLLDLGIAKVLEDPDGAPPLTRVSVGVPGTVHYMSPEQIRGLAVDARSDLYSVGVMLYRMLAGALPFVAASDAPYELMRLHCEAPPPLLRDAAPGAGVPADLDAAIQRALAKRPEDRWPDAEAFAAALAAIASQATRALAPPQLRTERSPALQGGLWRPLVALGLAGASVVALGALLLGGEVRDAGADEGGRRASASPAVVAAPGPSQPTSPAAAPAIAAEPLGPAPPPAADPSAPGHDHEQARERPPGATEAAPPGAAEPVPAARSRPPRRRAAPDPALAGLLAELEFQRPAFARCRALVPAGQRQAIRLDLTLAPGSGDVLAVTPGRRDGSEATACVIEALGRMHFHAGARGGTFKGLEIALEGTGAAKVAK